MLRIDTLTYRIGARVLLDEADASVNPGHRVGLVGLVQLHPRADAVGQVVDTKHGRRFSMGGLIATDVSPALFRSGNAVC